MCIRVSCLSACRSWKWWIMGDKWRKTVTDHRLGAADQNDRGQKNLDISCQSFSTDGALPVPAALRPLRLIQRRTMDAAVWSQDSWKEVTSPQWGWRVDAEVLGLLATGKVSQKVMSVRQRHHMIHTMTHTHTRKRIINLTSGDYGKMSVFVWRLSQLKSRVVVSPQVTAVRLPHTLMSFI